MEIDNLKDLVEKVENLSSAEDAAKFLEECSDDVLRVWLVFDIKGTRKLLIEAIRNESELRALREKDKAATS